MEPTSDPAPPPPAPDATATFTGRALSLEMGPVRLGGSGRPVAIAVRGSDGNDGTGAQNTRRQPRVVLEPQLRSPFGRKLETSVDMALSSVGTQPQPLQSQRPASGPPERVHTVHHPTHRTPVAVALRRADGPKAVPEPATSVRASRKRPAIGDTETSEHQARAAPRTMKAKTNQIRTVAFESPLTPASPLETASLSRASRANELDPKELALFTRKPGPAEGDQKESHGFHIHERLSYIVGDDGTAAVGGGAHESDDAYSGWRAVDDSIDHIYENPSIDAVQLRLLLNGHARSGEKRKAIERERLLAAAAEIQKQHQGRNHKLVEFQSRREQILKMSEAIRTRNKGSLQKSSAQTSTSRSAKKKLDEAFVQPTRKPPVPRLSHVGGKTRTTESKKKARTKDQDHPNDQREVSESKSPVDGSEFVQETSGAESEAERHLDNRASESILLSADKSRSSSSTATAKRPPSQPSKKRKASTPPTSQLSHSHPTTDRSPPLKENLQRRALAREYMQIQKQTRQLLRAKLDHQRQVEEERRRLELQRLEKTRLFELEEARKRRIRQKQRERIAQRKRDEEEHQLRAYPSGRLESTTHGNVEGKSRLDNCDDKDSENQSFRGNDPTQRRSVNDDRGFEWPDSGHSSRASSPRNAHHSPSQHNASLPAPEIAPKLQKLLALEEKTKMLAQKLQLLCKRRDDGDISAPSLLIDHRRAASIENDVERANVLESDHRSSEDSESASEDDEYLDDQHSATRVDQEDFVYFDGGFSNLRGVDAELDFSSIGVQKIQVVWPSGDDLEDVEQDQEETIRRSRFEVLSSSSSSSSSIVYENDHLDNHHNINRGIGSRSPKLLEDSVDAYAQRLLDLTARAQTSIPDESTATVNIPPVGRTNFSGQTSSSAGLRHKSSPPKRKHESTSSDAELLRLIRESDDNLSVIDREAKRRFRLQHDRLRQRQHEKEHLEQEKLKASLDIISESNQNRHPDTQDSGVRLDTRANVELPQEIEKLDQILEAVRTESIPQELGEDRDQLNEVLNPEVTEPASQMTTTIEFWNSQLHPARTAASTSSQRRLRVEVDRGDLDSQMDRHDEDDTEEASFERPRLLSPQALAKRLLAAVEFHDAIHDAHYQLSMMEKTHALEQVQQDTIALAQAFKEELDGNLLAQQLVDEHATLEGEFDLNLKHVVDQLETVREAEKRESEAAHKRLEEEARAARRRESAVQTEPPHQVDATTSARLRVDAIAVTDTERFDAAVQHSADHVRALPTFVDSSAITNKRVDKSEREDHQSIDDYEDETFDRASRSSPLRAPQGKLNPSVKVSDHDGSDVEEPEEIVSDRGQSSGAISEDDAEEISDDHAESDEEIQSEGVKSDNVRDDTQSVQDEVELMSVESTSRRQSHSVSVAYDDDDFEVDASFARVDAEHEYQNADVASEDGISEVGEANMPTLKPQSESASVGYDEDDFEHDVSMSQEHQVLLAQSIKAGDEIDSVDESSEAAVSSEYGEGDQDDRNDADSISDDPSFNAANSSEEAVSISCAPQAINSVQDKNAVPATAGEIVKTTKADNASVLTIDVNPSRVASMATVDPEITRAYTQQLENRKHSEEALLDIRLRALESKLQQDLQCVLDEIEEHDRMPTKLRDERARSELELRKDALQMSYLSEKATIESQKSACVARYYQDLLAFRSLGMATALATIRAPTGAPTAHLLPIPTTTLPHEQSALVWDQKPPEAEASWSDGYDEDEFVTSAAASDITAESRSREDVVNRGVEEDVLSVSVSASREQVDDEHDDISSEPGAVSEKDSGESISSSPRNSLDGEEDYGDGEFASVSESANAEAPEVVESAASVDSAPSIEDEPSIVTSTAVDDDSVAFEEGFATASQDFAIQEASSRIDEHATDAAVESIEVGTSAFVKNDDEGEVDETSQVYEDDEFVSVSEAASNSGVASVSENRSSGQENDVHGKSSKVTDAPSDDGVDDPYDDEFASVSETAIVPEDSDSVSEGDIQEHVHSDNDGKELEDDTERREESKSDDNYAEDDFEESEVAIEQINHTDNPPSKLVVAPQAHVAIDDNEQYSDEDFNPSEDVLQAAPTSSTHKTSEPNPIALDKILEHAPKTTAPPIDEGVASYELFKVKSLSTSELNVANAFQTITHDTAALPTALAESMSVSHEEDLTTASMEEQMKRIDDLKRQIDLRKDAFAAVQKKMRVEKKKEHLREAETQLWAEMEQLESQLVTDERVLELTRQRGRLESMELEAKHVTLHLRGNAPADLLADFDYCEAVERTRPAVIQQDHEAQVRLRDPIPMHPTQTVSAQITINEDHDLLLAFDHVEFAERPVVTIATNTDADEQRKVDSFTEKGSATHLSDRAAPVVPLLVIDESTSDAVSRSLSASHRADVRDVPPTAVESDTRPPRGTETDVALEVDLFTGYDHVEDVETVGTVHDLLHGYDHVEQAEEYDHSSSAENEDEDQTKLTVRLDPLHTHDELTRSDDHMILHKEDSTDDEVAEDDDFGDGDASELAEETALAKKPDELENTARDDVEASEAHDLHSAIDSNQAGRDSCQEHVSEEAVNDETPSNGEKDEDQEIYRNDREVEEESAEEPSNLKDKEERVHRTAEELLARLLRGAVADIHSASVRKVARETVLSARMPTQEEVKLVGRYGEATWAEEEIETGDDKTDSGTDVKQDREQGTIDSSQPNHAEFDGSDTQATREDSAETIRQSADTVGDQQRDTIVDRVFADLTLAAIREGLRVERKRLVPKGRQEPLHSTQSPIVSVRAPPAQPDRTIESAILLRLQLRGDQVTLPAFRDCVADLRGSNNARAIYDAVLAVAAAVHEQLRHDPTIRDEHDIEPKLQVLIDHVRQEMERSIWSVQERARSELDRFASKMLEEEQGDLNLDDVRLLQAHQRGGISSALLSHFQASALPRLPTVASSSASVSVITPRQRRRVGSGTVAQATTRGLASQILEQEEDQLADRITERMMRDLVKSESSVVGQRAAIDRQ